MENITEVQNEEVKLIEAAKKGDSEALRILVEKYQNVIFNFAFKVCKDSEKAFNVTQETFLSFIKNISQYSGKAKLSTWLYSIVSNHCLMEARKNKNSSYFSDDEELQDKDAFLNITFYHPEKELENEELKKILDEAINLLPQDYKLTFLLRDVEGLSVEETAKILNISESAVKTRTHRARNFLRKEILKKFEESRTK